MSRWVFVRHGESVANAEDWLAGHVDTPLTERGLRQAAAVGERLAGRRFARGVCSDLRRARHTARSIGVAVTHHPELRERHIGDWAHRPRRQMREVGDLALLMTWEGRPPGGESQADIAARVLPWLAALPPVEGDTLVVAHGGLIRVVLGLLDGLPRHAIGRNRIANCVPHEREVPQGRFRELCP